MPAWKGFFPGPNIFVICRADDLPAGKSLSSLSWWGAKPELSIRKTIFTPDCLGLGYSEKNLLLQGHWGPASNSGGDPKIPGTTGTRDGTAQLGRGEGGAEGAAEIRVGREKKALLFLMCLNWLWKEDISSWKPDPGATSLLLWEQLWELLGDGYIPELRVGNLRNLSSFWLWMVHHTKTECLTGINNTSRSVVSGATYPY